MSFSGESCILVVLVSVTVVFFSCEEEIVPEIFEPWNEHEAYFHGLENAGLKETALATEWVKAAEQSLRQPNKVEAPYREAFYLDPDNPEALGYMFSTRRGQKIKIDIDPINADSFLIFIDLFRYDSLRLPGEYEQVASAEKSELLLGFEPRSDGNYILRIQPELLRGGSFALEIISGPALEFPVMDRDRRAIGSFFGDPRDGGRRKHHGIDIFAKRHTPIVAPTDGYIRFVGERGLGGQVVWMRDHVRDMTLYFAHLQTINAKDDTWVKTGDTLGTVGNTGNARTTPPHLHFGIYKDGPVDPYYFVADLGTSPKRIRSEISWVGTKIRTRRNVQMRIENPGPNDVGLELPQYQLMEVKAAMASSYRVRLPNGEIGVLKMSDVETIEKPIRTGKMPEKPVLLAVPGDLVATIKQLDEEDKVSVLAKDMEHWFVRTAEGKNGWIEAMP
ncbi:MAG: M23 family metallopeptidase [Saprospiraceae bacterium]|nr:M23 family metallopeptidase [Saprospiraceae bacterium]